MYAETPDMDDIVAAYLADLRREGKSKDTIRRRRNILYRLDAALPYGLKTASYDELVDVLDNPAWGNQTRNSYTCDVRALYAWACDPLDPWLDFNPAQFLKSPKVSKRVPRPCSDDELSIILTQAADPYRLWAALAAYAGARCCEICRLDREHINRTRIILYGKGDKFRAVPTHDLIWSLVKDLPPGPLAVNSLGARWDPKQLSSKAGLYFREKLGLRGVTMHRLRHWFGTEVQSEQGDLRVTQELLGHASPATTAVYTLVADSKKQSAVAGLRAVA